MKNGVFLQHFITLKLQLGDGKHMIFIHFYGCFIYVNLNTAFLMIFFAEKAQTFFCIFENFWGAV